MRYLIPAFCLLFLAFSAAPALARSKVNDKLRVVTSFTVLADIAQNVAGDAADVQSIIKPGVDVHNYQPTPKDILKAQNADLILYNGLNLERWFDRFLQNLPDAQHVLVTQNITPLSIYEGEYNGMPNPHAWMSPHNAQIYINNIRDALSAADPQNAALYAQNAKAYGQAIQAAYQSAAQSLTATPEDRRYLVTSEGAFSYLAQDLAMQEAYLWPINAEQQGTPQQVRKIIDLVREQNIPVVFSESTVSDKPAKQIAHETGAHYGGVLYVDSLSVPDGPVPTYLDLLSVTITTIARGFSAAPETKESP